MNSGVSTFRKGSSNPAASNTPGLMPNWDENRIGFLTFDKQASLGFSLVRLDACVMSQPGHRLPDYGSAYHAATAYQG